MKLKFTLFFSLLLAIGWSNASAQSVVKPFSYYESIKYNWTDASGNSHEAALTDKATDPYQIYYLLREVYMNKALPGPYYSAYTANNVREDEVYYGGMDGAWNIPDGDYTPNEEGYTAVLISVKNSLTLEGTSYNMPGHITTTDELITYIGNNIESAELLTDGMRIAEGTENAGTVFNHSGTYNRFFFLGKGQARKDGYYYLGDEYMTYKYNGVYYTINDCRRIPFDRMFEEFSPTTGAQGDQITDYYSELTSGTSYPVIHDCASVIEAEHYFSMTGNTDTIAESLSGLNFFIPDYRLKYFEDYVQFYAYLDGQNVLAGYWGDGRQLNMWGSKYYYLYNETTGEYGTYQYGPYTSHSQGYAQYAVYNTSYQPQTMLYTIKLDAEVTATTDDSCEVTCTWVSSLDELAKTTVEQNYVLYIVITDPETGEVVYEELVKTTDNSYTYVVPREWESYTITYVVDGSPVVDEGYNFVTTRSNEDEVVIPGKDKLEALSIKLHHYESDYVAKDVEKNYYRNYINLDNGLANSITVGNLYSENDITLYRFPITVDSAGTYVESNGELVATSRLTAYYIQPYNSNGGKTKYYLLEDTTYYANGTVVANGYVGHGLPIYYTRYYDYDARQYVYTYYDYPASGAALFDSILYTADMPFDLSVIEFADTFNVSTAQNLHPAGYNYRAFMDAADYNGADTTIHSNLGNVPVFKTEIALGGLYTDDEVEDDKSHEVVTDQTLNQEVNVKLSGNTEIRYYSIERGYDKNSQYGYNNTSHPVFDGLIELQNGSYKKDLDERDATTQPADLFQHLEDGSYKEYINEVGYNAGEWGKYLDQRDADFNWDGLVTSAFNVDSLGYVPVIWTWQRLRKDGENLNTYGADIKVTRAGKVGMTIHNIYQATTKSATITIDGVDYAMFTPVVEATGTLPSVYDEEGNVYVPYKYRLWVKGSTVRDAEIVEGTGVVDHGSVAGQYYWLEDIDINSEDEVTTVVFGENVIDPETQMYNGGKSFLSKVLKDGETPDFEFVVRFYYKKIARTTAVNKLAEGITDGPAVAAAGTSGTPDPGNIKTAIFDILNGSNVMSTTYINAQGMQSTTPFDGVNIVVTRYSDGSVKTTKVVK